MFFVALFLQLSATVHDMNDASGTEGCVISNPKRHKASSKFDIEKKTNKLIL